MPDTLLGGIAINELLIDPNGATYNYDTDGNGTASDYDEYVELVNLSDSAIDISGLELWDAGVGQWFTFPSGSVLQPSAHALVIAGVQSGGSLPTGGADDLFFDAARADFPVFNNTGDNVVLYDPGADEYVQVTYNGATQADPTTWSGFSSTATLSGSGEDFGFDTDGLSLQRAFDTHDEFVSASPTPGITNVCFAAGTLIRTPTGEVPVEALRRGDAVVTVDHGPRPVRWVYAAHWAPGRMRRMRSLMPVRIRADTFAPGLPRRDLLLSQQHRVQIAGPIAKRMFGTHEILVAARHLCGIKGIEIHLPHRPISYVHLMLHRHELVFAEAVPSESLYLGPLAVKAIPEPGLVELEALLGLSREELARAQSPSARKIVCGRRARRLVLRHRRNRKPLRTHGGV